MSNTLLTLFSTERYKEHYGIGFWRDATIYSLVQDHGGRAPDRIAVQGGQAALTYRELLAAAYSFAADLPGRGIIAGQRVAVWLPNRTETVIALVACSRNGYVCCPSLHRDNTVEEIIALLKRMRASAVVAKTGYGVNADKHDLFVQAEKLDSLKHAYRLEPATAGASSKKIVAAKTKDEILQSAPAAQNSDRALYLAFTSGTTSVSKGVMCSDNTLLANARALSADWNITERSVLYSLSPLSHNLGLGAMIMALLTGGQLVVLDLPRGRSVVDRLIGTGTTFLVGVPTHAIDLLKEVNAKNLSGIGNLNGLRISGASAPREVVTELLKHGVVPQSGYGMTATCSHQYTLSDDDPKLNVESSGRSCPGYEIRIFDREDLNQTLSPREVGQIGGCGASLMLDYFDDQRATEDSFNHDGWFMAGDLGWVDELGDLRITGRKKDVIICGGHNIFPAKIEALASAHDAIQRVAAAPIADQRLGEKICLPVMLRRGKQASPDDILKHLDKIGLSKYDIPEYFLELDEIPLTASGKVRKRNVADWIADGRVNPTPIRWQAKTT